LILRASLVVVAVSAASLIIGAQAALAQKAGGILKIYNHDSRVETQCLPQLAFV
jgi:hypothetical protein